MEKEIPWAEPTPLRNSPAHAHSLTDPVSPPVITSLLSLSPTATRSPARRSRVSWRGRRVDRLRHDVQDALARRPWPCPPQSSPRPPTPLSAVSATRPETRRSHAVPHVASSRPVTAPGFSATPRNRPPLDWPASSRRGRSTPLAPPPLFFR